MVNYREVFIQTHLNGIIPMSQVVFASRLGEKKSLVFIHIR
jgi:hypothetical protein